MTESDGHPGRAFTRRQFVGAAGAMAGAVALGGMAGSIGLGTALPVGLGAVSGRVTTPAGLPVQRARVTLVGLSGAYVREVRTDASGAYSIDLVPPGTHLVGASSPGLEYRERAVVVAGAASASFVLGTDTHPGAWEIIGDTSPERFGGTNSGTLLPDGRIFYCHDTLDPVLFDPVLRVKTFPTGALASQGCHMPAVLDTGQLMLFGGGTMPASYQNPIKMVKAWDPATQLWVPFPDMLQKRWYPGLVRLADGRYLVTGGGIGATPPYRTASCEIYDVVQRKSLPTGDLTVAGGFDPIILLRNGEVFSGYTPQRYDPATGAWRRAAPMLQPNRGEDGAYPRIGSHSDHSLVMLPDGRIAAIGIRAGALGSPGSMVEVYDPAGDAWALGSSPQVLRSMPKVCMLPDGKVFCGAGKKEDASNVPVNPWGQTRVCDLWDPARDAWRRVADMTIAREYHAISMVIPDGRVIVTGGTGQPGIEGDDMRIEAFSPPYLFRGPRPSIDAVSSRALVRGVPFSAVVSKTEAVSALVLMGMHAQSHWMDGGPQRYLPLAFEQRGPLVTATLPASSAVVPSGWYHLVALVDGIPSPGVSVVVPQAG